MFLHNLNCQTLRYDVNYITEFLNDEIISFENISILKKVTNLIKMKYLFF